MDLKKFEKAVDYYYKRIGNVKGKSFFVVLRLDDEDAFFSIAPLSRAIHEKGGDIHINCFDGHSPLTESMLKTWKIHKDYKDNKKTASTKAFSQFLSFANKKAGENLERIFRAPDYILRTGKEGFTGSLNIKYKCAWVKKRKEKTLEKTCRVIWDQVYNLNKKDRVGLGFETIPSKNKLDMPLKDYLDSYLIISKMLKEAKKIAKVVTLNASTSRETMLQNSEKIGDLKATIMGCQLSKDINEAIFKRWKNLARFVGTSKIKQNTATFFIAGGGYPGRHAFGERIGYPTPNKKSRWQSPAGIIYQLPHSPQTKYDNRGPKARVGFTDTLPVEIFIKTNNIDWFKMKERNDMLAKVAEKSKKFVVKSNIRSKHKTEAEIDLVKKDNKKRKPLTSDVNIRNLIDKSFYKSTSIKAGNMGNVPGGEMFVTPEKVRGKIVGDVIINIDQSYRLKARNPFIIESSNSGYKVLRGPKKIIDKFNKKKSETKKLINKQAKIMPKSLIQTKRKNFNSIGEFAINTNPKAQVCDYLIVNEKIANMIHFAMGSGFEDDKATDYHFDLVVDAPRQKLDIFGVDDEGNKTYVMQKGKLLV
ncbi:MAG: hypothetical protein ACQESF_04485 [Nanobdellota archaeon]